MFNKLISSSSCCLIFLCDISLFKIVAIGGRLWRVKFKKDYICCNNKQHNLLALKICLLPLLQPLIFLVTILLPFDTKVWAIHHFLEWNFCFILYLTFLPIIKHIVMFVILLNTRDYRFIIVKVVVFLLSSYIVTLEASSSSFHRWFSVLSYHSRWQFTHHLDLLVKV